MTIFTTIYIFSRTIFTRSATLAKRMRREEGRSNRRARIFSSFAILIGLVCMTSRTTVAEPVQTLVQTPGIHEQEMTLEDGSVLRYTIALPSAYTPQQPTPLILALHYGGTVTPFYGKGLLTQLIEPALRDLKAIIIAPDSPAGGWANTTSETKVMQLLQTLGKQYAIDAQRTLVTGYSMGGVGTWYFATHQTEYFAAAIPISGAPPPGIDNVAEILPLYVIHSRKDELFPIAKVEQTLAQLKTAGKRAQLVSLDEPGHFDIGEFGDSLKAAIPWIMKIWDKS